MQQKQVIGVVDVGSSKIVSVIAEALSDGFKITGIGETHNAGVKQGTLVDMDKTAFAIKKAHQDAERMARTPIDKVWVSFGGKNISSFDSDGMVALFGREIKKEDIGTVIETASAVLVPNGKEIINVIPQAFIIDKQGGIENPIGMKGMRLDANVHIITALNSTRPNLKKCFEKAGLKIQDFVLQAYSSSLSVLSEDEKKLGCAIVDIGGGTCDIIAFYNGAVVMTDVIPIGGQHFTNDISIALKTSPVEAEKIKKMHGKCLPLSSEAEELIEVKNIGIEGHRSVAKKVLSDVIEARAEEMISHIVHSLKSSGVLNKMGTGIVLTGGGSELKGLIELAQYQVDVPVRNGSPIIYKGSQDRMKKSTMACSVGLLQFAFEQFDRSMLRPSPSTNSQSDQRLGGSIVELGKNIRDFLGLN